MAMFRKCTECGGKVPIGTLCKCEELKKRKRYKSYDKNIRYNKDNIKYASFYNNAIWIRLSEYIKIQYNGMCLQCLIENKDIKSCDVVHHIIPIRRDWSKRLDKDNLIPLCHMHHNSIDHCNITKEYISRYKDMLKLYKKIYK
ncbi:HNH endonuclease [Clostridium cochlearium]|uniref:HNH endonuclease n=1 Tax=Clostridium cochlearium TaxID=1494 RepID=UPI000BBC7D1C|nr:HNH endonuclease [Clostridium cochlearium]